MPRPENHSLKEGNMRIQRVIGSNSSVVVEFEGDTRLEFIEADKWAFERGDAEYFFDILGGHELEYQRAYSDFITYARKVKDPFKLTVEVREEMEESMLKMIAESGLVKRYQAVADYLTCLPIY